MEKKLSFIFLFTITFNFCTAQQKEEKLVRKSFENYKSAILNDKGDEAVKYVDSKTIQYYSEILDKTKNADSTDVNSLGLMDKLMVFSIRHRATKDEIMTLDGKGLLVYAIKKGMVGKNSVANVSIGDVKIEGTFAKGQFIANGQKAPFYFHFHKEDDMWKIDLTSIFPIGTAAFRKMQEDSGQEENVYLLSLLEMLTGKQPGNEVWKKTE